MDKIDQNKRKRINQAINLIEDLSWLIDSKKNLDLKEVPMLLRTLLESNTTMSGSNKYESPNPNKNYLIGILPNLFQDSELFKANLDLADFAENVLQITVSRAEKRSKYELIGLIVCEVINLNESDLSNLVNALSKLTGNMDSLKKIKEAKKLANFSWNNAIQELSTL